MANKLLAEFQADVLMMCYIFRQRFDAFEGGFVAAQEKGLEMLLNVIYSSGHCYASLLNTVI